MKKHYLFFLLVALSLHVSAQNIEHIYHFSNPVVSNVNNYQQIHFQGCMQSGITGQPTLAWQSISLLLPMNHEATSIEVIFSDFIELEGTYNLLPQQEARPISSTKTIPFSKDEAIYRSGTTYPSVTSGQVSTQYLNGTSFAFSSFTPIRYIPSSGKVSYAQTVKVIIGTQATREDHSNKLWLTPQNRHAISLLAQNAEMLDLYESRGREVSGYDILVVTPQVWVDRFDDYVSSYLQKGYRVHVAALEDIYNSVLGRDNQEKIRNYIIQEYNDNGIGMVLLGGDVALVPFRFLYCFVSDQTYDQIPADMYFACLDGTMNDDNDQNWGEVDEVDLVPELGIARLPFNNESQFDILMHKSTSYADTPVLGEFRTPILGGEHMGDGYYGSVSLERLIGECDYYDYTTIGYPVDYNFTRVYASETHDWVPDELRDAMANGGQYVHHMGHAATDYVAGWTNNSITEAYFAANNGIDHNYLPFHTHGCTCGNFPEDCIVERLITNPTGCVVSAGNSRYGWYIPFGDGPSDHLNRELVDAYNTDSIAEFGMAYRESKIMTAPWVTTGWGGGEYAALRWNFYDLNTFGDVALSIWCDEPFFPEVNFAGGLPFATSQTQVTVTKDGQPLDGFRVSYYDGDTLVGFALTDRNGIANITFEPALMSEGELQLIVTGQNARPQQFSVNVFGNHGPYIDVTAFHYNGIAEFGQTMTMDVTLENFGNETASGTISSLTCDTDHVTITQGTLESGTLEPNTPHAFPNAFSFDISSDIEDLSHVLFTISISESDTTWTKVLPLDITAPVISFDSIVVDDSQGNGNGLIDPDETILLHVYGSNSGHATAPDATLTATCNGSEITMVNGLAELGNIQAGNTFTGDITFTSDPNIVGGSAFDMDMEIASNGYIKPYLYQFTVGYAVETFESGDFSLMDWDFGGDLPWVITDSVSHQGNYCAQSGAIGDDQVSDLIITLNLLNAGDLSFYFKTSTERLDYLILYVDNQVIHYWSQDTDWTLFTQSLSAGEHIIKWRYDKSKEDTGGEDRVWLDDISFPSQCFILNVESIIMSKDNDIYPNPNDGRFSITLAESHSDVTIFNQLGQHVETHENVSGNLQINISGYASGVYFVNIKGNSGVETKKIVIR